MEGFCMIFLSSGYQDIEEKNSFSNILTVQIYFSFNFLYFQADGPLFLDLENVKICVMSISWRKSIYIFLTVFHPSAVLFFWGGGGSIYGTYTALKWVV